MLQAAFSHQMPGFDLNVEFAVPGGVTALFGPSGAGKSTIVKALTGLIRCNRAWIKLGDRVLDSDQVHIPPHRRRIGCVFQEPRLFPHLTVQQNLQYGRWFSTRSGLPFGEVVELLNLGSLLSRKPANLSGGEKSRTAIGRALLSDPELLVMDEPLAALDEALKAEIFPYLERLRDVVKMPMIYVSHSLPEVARLATNMVVLDKGQMLRAGATNEILSDPGLSLTLGLRDAGAVISAKVSRIDPDGMTILDTPAGQMFLHNIRPELGASLRLRIPAQDVILSRERPVGLSALNILSGQVMSLTPIDASSVMVELMLVDQAILARLTRRSVAALALQPGTACYAILKSVAISGAG